MLARDILKHSFMQVTGNIGALKRIMALPVAVHVIGSIAIIFWTARSGIPVGSSTEILSMLLAVLLMFVPVLWVAVNWHRYVLLNELRGASSGFPLRGAVSYALTGIGVFVLAFAPAFVAMGLIMLLGSNGIELGGLLTVLMFPVIIIAMILSIRLSTALPAAAIGEPNAIATAWRETSGHNGTFFLLAIALALLQIPFEIINQLASGATSILGVIAGMLLVYAAMWIYVLISLSVLTTLYGYFVEKRALR